MFIRDRNKSVLVSNFVKNPEKTSEISEGKIKTQENKKPERIFE